jgi:DNA (cytosine-5)-methyltransferase 1
MTDRVLKVADIYCGAGGLSSGVAKARLRVPGKEHARFAIVYGLDKDQNAVETFNRYHKSESSEEEHNIAECLSVTRVDGKHILDHAQVSEIDVLIAGPNCQGVSAAGLRNPRDKRNEMFRRFLELIRDLQPKWFIMENVPGLTHANNRKLLRTIMRALNEIPGYKVSADVLLAAHYGVPQFRYRLFVIGNRINAPIRFPNPKIEDPKEFKTVKSAIWHLRHVEPSKDDEKAKSKLNHYIVDIGEKNVKRIAAIKPGEDWRDMPVGLLPERFFATRASDQKGTYGRLEWDWPAYTITASVSNVTAGPFTHPKHNRPLSVREAARLQSFDDKHIFCGPIDSQYRQVGNAVPPLLAKAVAEAVLYCHFNREKAKHWGHEGRITLDLLESEAKGKKTFPTLTPRFPGKTPKWERKQIVKVYRKPQIKAQKQKFEWEPRRRPRSNFPAQLGELKRLAQQPGNYRAAKRARAILSYFEKRPENQIVRQAKVSKASIEKWVAGFQQSGLEGWRAYHTPIDRAYRKGIQKIRKSSPEYILAINGNKRLHMNEYLRKLIHREELGEFSVRELITKVEEARGDGIGTVYVGDLLAICDAALPKRNNKKTQHSTKLKR